MKTKMKKQGKGKVGDDIWNITQVCIPTPCWLHVSNISEEVWILDDEVQENRFKTYVKYLGSKITTVWL